MKDRIYFSLNIGKSGVVRDAESIQLIRGSF